jgi:hypothetical protein
MTLRSLIAVALALTAASLPAALPASASVSPSRGITGQFNQPMCGSNDFERVKTPLTEFAVSDSAGTCVDSERYHADFNVAKVTEDIGWQYPNVASGFTPEGEATCADPRRDTCFAYPVRQEDDGTPLASFGSWLAPGSYNESFDIWFSPVKSRHSFATRAGDTELMIWLAFPGIDDRSHFVAYATIDHKRFGIMTWIAGGDRRYVAYLWLNAPRVGSGRRLDVSGLWLNPIFRNAESHGWLRSWEWLWSVDLGFELRWGGQGVNIHDYSLTGLPASR